MSNETDLDWLARNVHDKFEPFTSIEDNQELPISKQQETQQGNGWFDRGELPPVGAVCLYVISERRSCEVEITAHARFGICFSERGKSNEFYVSKTAELHRFRPIRTERDELMDVITFQVFLSKDGDICGKIADAILAAGYRKETK